MSKTNRCAGEREGAEASCKARLSPMHRQDLQVPDQPLGDLAAVPLVEVWPQVQICARRCAFNSAFVGVSVRPRYGGLEAKIESPDPLGPEPWLYSGIRSRPNWRTRTLPTIADPP